MPDLKPPGAPSLAVAGAPSLLSPRGEGDEVQCQKSTAVPMYGETGEAPPGPSLSSEDRPDIVNDRWHLTRKMGEGAFGMVFKGMDKDTQDLVACKLEDASSPEAGMLENEATLLRMLANGASCPKNCFPHVFFYGKQAGWNILTMELLGLTLEDAMDLCGKLDLRSVLLIVDRLIVILAYLHSRCIVHRDIKCENFMFGRGPKAHHLHMIDFGMSCPYWVGKRHQTQCRGQDLTGTARYASINAMKGSTQSRRDDLEAVGYMLIHLLKGSLPWAGLKVDDFKERLQRILYMKRTMPVEELCKDLPEEFESYVDNAKNMRFDKRPNYDAIRGMFRELREKQSPPIEDHHLLWLVKEDSKLKVEDPSLLEPLQTIDRCAAQPEETGGVTAEARKPVVHRDTE